MKIGGKYLSILIVLICGCLLFTNCSSGDDGGGAAKLPPITVGPEMTLYGLLADEKGDPIVGVAVSDGYQVVLTDDKGVYQMKKTEKAEFVYYSTPAEYELHSPTSSTTFYQQIESQTKRYDFTLEKREGGVAKRFNLIGMGDPQVTNATNLARFNDEIIPDVKETAMGSSLPTIGIALGDIVSDTPNLMQGVKNALKATDVTFYATIGNHDKIKSNDPNNPRSTYAYTTAFGPLNYSFNCGDVHFVCLDDIYFDETGTSYTGGFEDFQVEWLKQDLKSVPDSKMVIVYYHIPLRQSPYLNRDPILSQLQRFANVHLMAGHTHYHYNYYTRTPFEIYEHIHGAACGSWWNSVINGDGTPIGYAVYEIDGVDFVDRYYKSARYDKKHQIRLHRGDASFGGTYGFYTYGQTSLDIIANVWNADRDWKVEIYENDQPMGVMEDVSGTIGLDFRDAWSKGYQIGITNKSHENYNPQARHLFKHTLTTADAQIKVVATDKYGNVYSETEITTSTKSAGEFIK